MPRDFVLHQDTIRYLHAASLEQDVKRPSRMALRALRSAISDVTFYWKTYPEFSRHPAKLLELWETTCVANPALQRSRLNWMGLLILDTAVQTAFSFEGKNFDAEQLYQGIKGVCKRQLSSQWP